MCNQEDIEFTSASEWLGDITEDFSPKGPALAPLRLSTGLAAFDERFGGIPAPGITTLIGKPGVGRTSFCLNFALWRARRGERVLIIPDFRRYSDIGSRLLSVATGLPSRVTVYGAMNSEEWGRLVAGIKELSTLPIWVCEWCQETDGNVLGWLKAARDRQHISVVIADPISSGYFWDVTNDPNVASAVRSMGLCVLLPDDEWRWLLMKSDSVDTDIRLRRTENVTGSMDERRQLTGIVSHNCGGPVGHFRFEFDLASGQFVRR